VYKQPIICIYYARRVGRIKGIERIGAQIQTKKGNIRPNHREPTG